MGLRNAATLTGGTSTGLEKMPVGIFANAKEACAEVAREIATLVRSKQNKGEYAVLGLATGSSPKKLYEELIRLHRKEGLSFSNVVAFNLDEYYHISTDSAQSYHRFMKEQLFDHIDINPDHCYIPNGETPQELVKMHCEEYEKLIAQYGGIDLQILGIGRNGHIGFNEPGSHRSSVTRLITLDYSTRLDAAREFGNASAVPRKAITMGVKTILEADRIILMAWGESKAAVLQQAIEGPETEFVPASYLQSHSNVEFMLDASAASRLSRMQTPWLTDEVLWTKWMIKKAVIHLSLLLDKPVLKLINADYNENGLSDLLALYGQAHDINIEVFSWLQQTITGWPGGKPGTDDSFRPERAEPRYKRVLIFSPHPDDDIISMGGTFQRLVDQGHEVHVAYQTSGNIAVADDEALRFTRFVQDFDLAASDTCAEILNFLHNKKQGEKDIPALRTVKELIRRGEARSTCAYVGVPEDRIHFLKLPFYETGTVRKNPMGAEDVAITAELISRVKPHQVFAAGDLADPHGTHKVCLDVVTAALKSMRSESYMKDCWLWLYKGAWEEWDIDQIDMAVPMSPDQVLRKRYGIFKHQSQKDGVVFQGTDHREFWQRAEDRNRATAERYNQLGLAEYAAMEAFVRVGY